MRGAYCSVAALIAFSTTTVAQVPDNAVICFGRAYTSEHLAAHPGQSVVEMQVVMDATSGIEPAQDDVPVMVGATVRATVRDRFGEFFANFAICDWDAGAALYDCGIECDGGRFQIVLEDGGTAMLRNEQHGFVLFGGCGEDVEAGREVRIPADVEHAAFRLYPLPVEACPIGLWQLFDDAF